MILQQHTVLRARCDAKKSMSNAGDGRRRKQISRRRDRGLFKGPRNADGGYTGAIFVVASVFGPLWT
jgi:hypothetical protein